MDITKSEIYSKVAKAKAEVAEMYEALVIVDKCANKIDALLSRHVGYKYEGMVHTREGCNNLGQRALVTDYIGIRILSKEPTREYYCGCAYVDSTTGVGAHLRIGPTDTTGWSVEASALCMCVTYTFAQEVASLLNEIYVEHGELILKEAVRCCVENRIY